MKTIYGKFMVAFMGMVIVIFAFIFIGTEFFIEDFYYKQKVTVMQNTVKQIRNSREVSGNALEFIESLEYLGYHFEGKIKVYDVESGLVISDRDVQRFSDGIVIKSLDMGDGRTYILETNYPVTNTRWLVYYDLISDNTLAILQIPVTAIEHTIDAMSLFMLYVAGVAIGVAMIMAAFISSNMTKPIKELTIMADQIRQLKFDIRYKGNRKDEIGHLGEAFNSLTERLDTTIKALTFELSKEKQLDKLSKEFVAQVSHELQTPLSIIHGYIEALEDGVVESEEERQEYYQIIFEESDKMSRMIKDLLQLSELEAGTFRAIEEEFDLCDFFDHLNQDYQTLLSHSDIDLSYTSINEETAYFGDRLKLEQAFRNILNNAKKYAENNTVIVFDVFKKDKMIQVIIENEGPKIVEDEIAKIFGSFFKGKNSEGKEGSGIGLAVASKVFEYHRMSYYVKNTEKGVKFVINMPIRGIEA